MSVISELLESIEHAKEHLRHDEKEIEKSTVERDLSDLRLFLDNVNDVVAMQYRIDQKKIPGKERPVVNSLFEGLKSDSRTLENLVHVYNISSIAHHKIGEYEKLLQKHPEKIYDVITDQHLIQYLKKTNTRLNDFRDVYAKLGNIMKNASRSMPAVANHITEYLKRLEGIVSPSYQSESSKKHLLILIPFIGGLAFLASRFRAAKDLGTGYAASITEPVTLISLVATVAIAGFFIFYFKNFSKIQQRFL